MTLFTGPFAFLFKINFGGKKTWKQLFIFIFLEKHCNIWSYFFSLKTTKCSKGFINFKLLSNWKIKWGIEKIKQKKYNEVFYKVILNTGKRKLYLVECQYLSAFVKYSAPKSCTKWHRVMHTWDRLHTVKWQNSAPAACTRVSELYQVRIPVNFTQISQ